MRKLIYPCLWFNGNAKEAAEFYCSVFPQSEITSENPMVVVFESSGQKFMCLNGGPEFTFNPSISFYVILETESETDRVWDQLLKGGEVHMPLDKYEWSRKYGWLQDRFGVSWQISCGKIADVGQRFSASFMFTGRVNGMARQAVQYYTSVFKNSEIDGILEYTKDDDDIAGHVKHAQFRLNGLVFMAMDSSLGSNYSFNEAISMVVECDTQEQIDYFWNKLTDGGEENQCGWLKDRFGVSWQIVPVVLEELMNDPARSKRVLDAFLQMKKFDIEKLVTA